MKFIKPKIILAGWGNSYLQFRAGISHNKKKFLVTYLAKCHMFEKVERYFYTVRDTDGLFVKANKENNKYGLAKFEFVHEEFVEKMNNKFLGVAKHFCIRMFGI